MSKVTIFKNVNAVFIKKRYKYHIEYQLWWIMDGLWKSYSFLFIIWSVESKYVVLSDLDSNMVPHMQINILLLVVSWLEGSFSRVKNYKWEEKDAWTYFMSIILLVHETDLIIIKNSFSLFDIPFRVESLSSQKCCTHIENLFWRLRHLLLSTSQFSLYINFYLHLLSLLGKRSEEKSGALVTNTLSRSWSPWILRSERNTGPTGMIKASENTRQA